MDRRHQGAESRQLPCAVKTPQGRRFIVTRAPRPTHLIVYSRFPVQVNPTADASLTGEPSDPVNPVNPVDPVDAVGIDVRRLPWVKRLAADYVYDFAGLTPFFSGNPADRSAWAA